MEHSREKQETKNVQESNYEVKKTYASSLQDLFNYMRAYAEKEQKYFFRSDDDADDFLASD